MSWYPGCMQVPRPQSPPPPMQALTSRPGQQDPMPTLTGKPQGWPSLGGSGDNGLPCIQDRAAAHSADGPCFLSLEITALFLNRSSDSPLGSRVQWGPLAQARVCQPKDVNFHVLGEKLGTLNPCDPTVSGQVRRSSVKGFEGRIPFPRNA